MTGPGCRSLSFADREAGTDPETGSGAHRDKEMLRCSSS